jgi:hypothetical protein
MSRVITWVQSQGYLGSSRVEGMEVYLGGSFLPLIPVIREQTLWIVLPLPSWTYLSFAYVHWALAPYLLVLTWGSHSILRNRWPLHFEKEKVWWRRLDSLLPWARKWLALWQEGRRGWATWHKIPGPATESEPRGNEVCLISITQNMLCTSDSRASYNVEVAKFPNAQCKEFQLSQRM